MVVVQQSHPCIIHSQCRKIDLEGELKLRMLDHNIISIKRQCIYFALTYIIKCICQDTWYTLCLEQLYYCTGAHYSSLCTLVHICSCLHYTLKLPGDSLASVLSTKPLNFTTPPTKAGYRGGGTPPKNCFKLNNRNMILLKKIVHIIFLRLQLL